ncbi:hypothetical protein [Pseudomonas protegens]|uniref:hypothetical protein n=1 Tax=Pseudomonas protegens TaxID=380021 RepID=UPI00215D735E|nr:hypothetical protein [Pseudomonas protegens]
MNPTAQRALERAREKPAPALLPPILANPPLPEIIITGPINRVMELEGKRYAVDVVQSAGADIRRPQVVEKIIRNLTTYAVQQPPSVAKGIKTVIDLLRAD